MERGPVEHLARGGVVVAVVHPPGDCRVVIAEHGDFALLPDQIAGLVRVGPVTDRIS